MMKKLMIAAAAMQLGVVACVSTGQKIREEKAPVRAYTLIVQPETIATSFDAPGTIRARTQTVLSSKVVGQITSLPVHEGDRVRQGQVLVEVEGRDVSAQLRRATAAEIEARRSLDEVDGSIRSAEAGVRAAEANLELAQVTRKRFEMLRERHSVSAQEFDEVDARFKSAASETDRARETVAAATAKRAQVNARIEQAEAEVESARTAVGYLKITSPINGVVSRRHVDAGMLATPGMPLVTVEDDSTYELESIIEESRGGAITIGQHVVVKIDAAGVELDGRVREIVPAADPATRTYNAKVAFLLPASVRRIVRSGTFARASFPAGERQALIVPESALVHRGQLTGLFVVQDDTALLRLVKAGRPVEEGIEILSGLSAGTRILMVAGPNVSDGVRIIDANREGSAP
jgi:multidrug efflux pump subunit AcrA (membrane-fusion protein)